MDANYIYCDNHVAIYVCQVIILYTLNLHNVVSQSYLNKAKNKIKMEF